MKAFSFRLEQVRRWRAAQVDVQKSRLAAASGRLAEIKAAIEARQIELSSTAAQVSEAKTGADLEAWDGFRDRMRARIRDLEGQALVAQRTVAMETNRMIEANQKLKLIENLKDAAHGAWHHEFERELSAFADEAFLARYNQKGGRARSSGG